jgi:hypothetical protein
MAILAVGLTRLLRREGLATKDVGAVGDGLKVERVAAVSVAATVVEHLVGRYGTNR